MTFRRLMTALVFCLMPWPALAQEEPIFDSYEDMRAQLDRMMMGREIKDAMLRFGGSSSMTPEDLDNLQTRMREIYPYDFRNVAIIDRREMENGFAHEIYAYWSGLRYLYVLVFMHEQDDDTMVSINIRFNTDFYELIRDL